MACAEPCGRIVVRASGLPLCPWQTASFPAGVLPSMPLRIEWPFKSVSNIAAVWIACRRHGPCSHQAASAGPADEEQLAALICPCCVQRLDEAIDKAGVDPVVWKALPLQKERPLADGSQIRKADKRPLCLRSDIDQHRTRIRLQSCPSLFHRHVVDVDRFRHRHVLVPSPMPRQHIGRASPDGRCLRVRLRGPLGTGLHLRVHSRSLCLNN
jgi:hypothetical protein